MRRHAGPDNGDTTANQIRFLEALELERFPLMRLHQRHSSVVVPVEGDGSVRMSGDALVTQYADCTLAVEVADCLAVLLVDEGHRVVAAIHAGWRGTLKEISKKTMLQMQKLYGSQPRDCYAAFGPAIDVCCYEVGSDVIDQFVEKFAYTRQIIRDQSTGHRFLNLKEANRIQLIQAGLTADRILDRAGCTLCLNELFFSYRKEGPGAGRMMGVVALQSG